MTQPLRVLLVEDSEEDAALLLRHLRRVGYETALQRVDTPAAMSAALDQQPWDLVISDYTMPHFGAKEALALLKKSELDLPFLILSGSIGEEIAVASMKAGAHDYIMKDNLSRLVPAIERELREAEVRRQRKSAERELRESIERFKLVTRATNDVIWDWDMRTNAVWWNEGAAKLLRYPSEEVGIDFNWWQEHLHPDEKDRVVSGLHRVVEESGQFWSDEYRFLRGDDTYANILDRAYVVYDNEGKPVRMIGAMLDITERKKAEEVIKRMAYYDTLTGLPNRTLFHNRLQQAILTGQAENRPLALLLMDLNHFKEINDTLGHHQGDVLLQQVGPRLKGVLPPSAVIGRLGGDEFAVLLPGTDGEGAAFAARQILKILEPSFVVGVLTLDVGASIGVALWPDHGEDAYTLLQRADVAMYMAKQSPNGYILYSSERDPSSPRRLALMGELRHAIDQDQLFPLFQPKVNSKTKRVIGVETLVRWQHPNFGVIPPDQFITLAEQTGLIKPLTMAVFNGALRQCRAWRKEGIEISVAVNLSVRNLQDPQLPNQVAELLRTYDVPSRLLTLEITESIIMADPVRAMEVLAALSKMGIQLSIDDFGTGYSSLGYLKKLTVDEIKIDKSFVKEMATNEDDIVIVRSTIDLAHNLGLKVVAEGVETKEIWDKLVAFGCDAAQGYYISRPVKGPELTPWLNDSPWGLKALSEPPSSPIGP